MTVESLITQHIDTWTSAVKNKSTSGRGSSKKIELYGVKKLRELILELAVRGKLVPQDSNDEPASVLLERIAAEKAQLVKDKKIKKTKLLPVISDDEKSFELPLGWIQARFGECFLISSGNSFKKDEEHSEGEFIYCKVGDMNLAGNENSITTSSAFISPTEKQLKSLISSGSIIFPKRGGAIATNKKRFVRKPIFSDSNVMAVKPFYGINLEFSMLWLNSIDLAALNTGTSVPQINNKDIEPLIFYFPPENEQRRIVAKVDELMTLCDQLEQQTEACIEAHQLLVSTLLNTLTNSADANELMENWARISDHFDTLFTTEESIDQLKQTILQLAVMGKLVPQDPNDEPASVLLERIAEEKALLIKEKKIKKQKALPPIADDEKPFELPNGWEWERIGTFGVVGTGATPSRSNPKYWDSPDYNWVSSGETADLFVGQTKEKVSALAIKETNVSVYPVGTLIVAMYGQGKTRGQITELSEPAGTNQACAAISLIESNVAHKDFVKLYFRKSYEELRSNAAGGAQPNLNVGKIQSTVIAVPPLHEQQRINAKVHSLLELCESIKCKLAKAQATQLHLTDAIVEQAV
ncbi:TPA: restriction endonuclease subunit S [Photobacterium damselae]